MLCNLPPLDECRAMAVSPYLPHALPPCGGSKKQAAFFFSLPVPLVLPVFPPLLIVKRLPTRRCRQITPSIEIEPPTSFPPPIDLVFSHRYFFPLTKAHLPSVCSECLWVPRIFLNASSKLGNDVLSIKSGGLDFLLEQCRTPRRCGPSGNLPRGN